MSDQFQQMKRQNCGCIRAFSNFLVCEPLTTYGEIHKWVAEDTGDAVQDLILKLIFFRN